MFEPDNRASTTVVEAVSSAARVAPERLPVLYEVIDPDALDALFHHVSDGSSRFDGRVSFAYAGYTVTVSRQNVSVQPSQE